jgi:hypothetical protein
LELVGVMLVVEHLALTTCKVSLARALDPEPSKPRDHVGTSGFQDTAGHTRTAHEGIPNSVRTREGTSGRGHGS